MLNKLILLSHAVVQNDPGVETISAGLGPAEQYGISLIFLVVIGIIAYFKRKKK